MGNVKIEEQNQSYVRRISNPGYYGQTSFFRHEMWKCSVHSETVSEIVRLSRTSLHSLIDIYPNMGDQYLEVREALDHGNFLLVGTNRDQWEKELQLVESAHGFSTTKVITNKQQPQKSLTLTPSNRNKHGGDDLSDREGHHAEAFPAGRRKSLRNSFTELPVTTDETDGLSDGDKIPGTVQPRIDVS